MTDIIITVFHDYIDACDKVTVNVDYEELMEFSYELNSASTEDILKMVLSKKEISYSHYNMYWDKEVCCGQEYNAAYEVFS